MITAQRSQLSSGLINGCIELLLRTAAVERRCHSPSGKWAGPVRFEKRGAWAKQLREESFSCSGLATTEVLSRNYAVEIGSATVPVAPVGVSPTGHGRGWSH